MKTFTYKSPYATYENCYFRNALYNNGNLAVLIENETEGPICRVTVNLCVECPEDCIVVKNYSENSGMDQWLIEQGFVESEPVKYVNNEFISCPMFKLTKKGKEYIFGE